MDETSDGIYAVARPDFDSWANFDFDKPRSAGYGHLMVAARTMLDDLAAASPPDADCYALADRLMALAAELRTSRTDYPDRPFGQRLDLVGKGQALIPAIRLTDVSPDSARGTVRFGDFHHGARGAAHGGAIPLIFDEVLGRLANSYGRGAARTAYLRMDYRAVAPVGVELQLAADLVSEEGRKLLLRGTLSDGARVCVEAEALFVALLPHHA